VGACGLRFKRWLREETRGRGSKFEIQQEIVVSASVSLAQVVWDIPDYGRGEGGMSGMRGMRGRVDEAGD
jgi:hypothetical protein